MIDMEKEARGILEMADGAKTGHVHHSYLKWALAEMDRLRAEYEQQAIVNEHLRERCSALRAELECRAPTRRRKATREVMRVRRKTAWGLLTTGARFGDLAVMMRSKLGLNVEQFSRHALVAVLRHDAFEGNPEGNWTRTSPGNTNPFALPTDTVE